MEHEITALHIPSQGGASVVCWDLNSIKLNTLVIEHVCVSIGQRRLLVSDGHFHPVFTSEEWRLL